MIPETQDQVQLIADGQPVYVDRKPFMAIVHEGDMNVEAPNHYLIGPEQTLEKARGLSQGDWDAMREHPKFLRVWSAMWDPVQPPVDLQKASMAVRHSVGMIMMLIMAKANNLPVHLQYPETYLHPKQQARVMTMIMAMGYQVGS